MEKAVEGIDYKTQLAKVTLRGVVDRPGVAADVFGALGQHGLNVEFISTNTIGRGRTDIMFAVVESELDNVVKVLQMEKEKYGTRKIDVDRDCALITIYGPMLSSTPGIAGKICTRLSENKINIEMINASMSALNIVVSKEKVMDAVGALRAEFGI